jgi:hypothetical protein
MVRVVDREAHSLDHPDPIGARFAAFFVHYNLERDTLAVVQFISVCDVARMPDAI